MTASWPIGVVTSAWGTYGRYLPKWVESVAAQTVRPELVTVLDAGVDDIGPAREALDESGLPWQIVRDTYRGMGAARNRAVEATATEWVMHLDADDLLLPHCLADVRALAPWADVVSVGMRRGRRDIVFPHVSARQALAGRQAAFSCAAFRRDLWERRGVRWHTANDWVDSALWVRAARAGARFAGTSRPGAVYRQHAGSFSRRLTHRDRAAARAQLDRMVRDPAWSP
ncbi:glycosyltransferase family A protein [Streptomyces sp. DSM 44915]|uniref:Glycosyltransferase family A protein n=1 Tax=Streptomyces chisholmiae TaxID=3075540 RepID=A0ABU2K1F1_9ACTN|nr:glycosyltransferase family A protein [Streptomyces sp. DSM 44915]MDT0270589.1 glycosyltransferase family A protein [Streptomyces sp. DSM 44915]